MEVEDNGEYWRGWRQGAEDEAAARREGLSSDQVEALELVKIWFLIEDCSLSESLVVCARVFAADWSRWRRIKLAWRVIR